MLPVIRVIVAVLAALIALGGLAAVSVGEVAGGLWAVALGGVGLLAVVLERSRYRSQAAEHRSESPGPGGGEPTRPAPPFRLFPIK